MINLQPTLENNLAILNTLSEKDFDKVYAVASDYKIWEQHPNKDRWKKDVFRIFFDGAMQSKGAFKVIERATAKIIGCTRFYNYNEQDSSLFVGYTFYGVIYWGRGFNPAVKLTMLDYAFKYVEKIYFHIGAENVRSQISISRLGAEKVGEEVVAYFGEKPRLNFTYRINKINYSHNANLHK